MTQVLNNHRTLNKERLSVFVPSLRSGVPGRPGRPRHNSLWLCTLPDTTREPLMQRPLIWNQDSRDTALTHNHIKRVALWHTCTADCIKQLGETTQTHNGCRLGHVQHLDSNLYFYINLKGSLWPSGFSIQLWKILNKAIAKHYTLHYG